METFSQLQERIHIGGSWKHGLERVTGGCFVATFDGKWFVCRLADPIADNYGQESEIVFIGRSRDDAHDFLKAILL